MDPQPVDPAPPRPAPPRASPILENDPAEGLNGRATPWHGPWKAEVRKESEIHVAPSRRDRPGTPGHGRGVAQAVRGGGRARARGAPGAGPRAERGRARRPRGPGSRGGRRVRAHARRTAAEGGPVRGGFAMKRTIVAALGVATLGLPAAARPQAAAHAPEVLTFEEAVALALQNNRRVAVAAMDVQRADARVEAYRTQRLPSFDLQANAGTMLNAHSMTFPGGAFGTYPGVGPIPTVETIVEVPRTLSGYVSATVAQPLSQLHRIGLGTKLQELSRDGEKERLRSERTAVAAETRRLYYALLQIQASAAAADEQVKLFREMDRVVSEHVAQETALPADGLDVKARLASAEYDAARARNELATRKEQLNHLLGRDPFQEFTVAEVTQPSPAEADLQTALGEAVARRPDLAQARLAVEQADTDQRLKKAESIPDVSVALTYTSFVNVDLMPTKFAQLGLQFKWEPFDWGRKGKERAEKALVLLQAQSNAREAESGARLEVAQTFRRLREAQLLLDASRLAREASHERLRTVTDRYREEATLLRDLLEAQASASSADARWTEALMTFWSIRADFRKALGEEQ